MRSFQWSDPLHLVLPLLEAIRAASTEEQSSHGLMRAINRSAVIATRRCFFDYSNRYDSQRARTAKRRVHP